MKKVSKTILILTLTLIGFHCHAQKDPLKFLSEKVKEKSMVYSFNDTNLKWEDCPEFMPKGCAISVLHGNPAKENLDVFFKVPANSIIPMHKHLSAERIIMLSGKMEVQYINQEPDLLYQGVYAFGPANLPHKAKCLNFGPCVLFIAFNEPFDASLNEAID